MGIAQGALDYDVAYVKERRQFGRAVADFEGVQVTLANMAMELEAAWQLVYAAAAKSERGDADLPFLVPPQVLRVRRRDAGHDGCRAAARRCRVHA